MIKFVLFTKTENIFQYENLYSSFIRTTQKRVKKKKGRTQFCSLLGVNIKANGSIVGIPQINVKEKWQG